MVLLVGNNVPHCGVAFWEHQQKMSAFFTEVKPHMNKL